MASELMGTRWQQKFSDLLDALLQERDRLRRNLERRAANIRILSQSQADEGGPCSDQADLASDLAAQSTDQDIAALEQRLLREIEGAIRRFAMGAYGFCERCYRPIAPERLEALPWTRHCRECAPHGSGGGRG